MSETAEVSSTLSPPLPTTSTLTAASAGPTIQHLFKTTPPSPSPSSPPSQTSNVTHVAFHYPLAESAALESGKLIPATNDEEALRALKAELAEFNEHVREIQALEQELADLIARVEDMAPWTPWLNLYRCLFTYWMFPVRWV